MLSKQVLQIVFSLDEASENGAPQLQKAQASCYFLILCSVQERKQLPEH